MRIIDYENNQISSRETTSAFREYVKQLVSHLNFISSTRTYVTRSVHTEVINSILSILKNPEDEINTTHCIDTIALRLLSKEIEIQNAVAHMAIQLQKGSLIQALLFNPATNSHSYLLAKVEHSDFVDDLDFSFKTGFSKDMKKIWKTCVFTIPSTDEDSYQANVYLNTSAKYWTNEFLELDPAISDETNTDRAFRGIDLILTQNIKKTAPYDHTILRNSVIGHFRSNYHISYDEMIESIFVNYTPQSLSHTKLAELIVKLKELPDKKNFNRHFTSAPSVITARIKSTYELSHGVYLKITDSVPDITNTIIAVRDPDGTQYIKVRTHNESVFNRFYNPTDSEN